MIPENLFLTLSTTLSGLDVGERLRNWAKVSLKHVPEFRTEIDFLCKKPSGFCLVVRLYFVLKKTGCQAVCLSAGSLTFRQHQSVFFRRLCGTVFPHIQAIETGFWRTFFHWFYRAFDSQSNMFLARRNHSPQTHIQCVKHQMVREGENNEHNLQSNCSDMWY